MSAPTKPISVELMATLDEKNLRSSIEFTAAHIGAIMVIDAAPLLTEDGRIDRPRVLRAFDRAIAKVPEFSKRMIPAPLGLTAAVWVPDESFDIARHVYIVDEVTPLEDRTLRRLAGFERDLLDRRLPLWDATVTLLDNGQIAVGVRLHHVVGDAKWAFDTLTLLTEEELSVDDGTPPLHARDTGRAPRTRLLLPLRVLRDWWREQPSLRAAWAEYSRKPVKKRISRMVGRNIRWYKEWVIRRRNLAAQYLPPNRSAFFSISRSSAEAAASSLGGSLTDLIVAALLTAVDDDDRGRDALVPVTRRVKGDRSVRNDVSVLRVHVPPAASAAEMVKAVRRQIRLYVVGSSAGEQPEGRKVGYATYLPWSQTPRFLLGSPMREFIAFPAVDPRDEMSAFALTYADRFVVTVTGRAEFDVSGTAEAVRAVTEGALRPVEAQA
ncbi:wax ester/triacylglycerol synthase domain-containing protein [Microbacterium kunmingense]|uniref:wax ester/triacylglycerol synthase domain-containing protein n=1 Tax=Microbacterium kunmingense TaxID=2915939 RepID=UPI0020059FB2|nr:wax ester/triacylglycerol synthase domain-containing protein [Microbacterium kunmingense]